MKQIQPFTLIAMIISAAFVAGCSTTGSSLTATEPTTALNYLNPDKTSDSVEAGLVNKWRVLGPFSFEKKKYKKEEEGCQEALDDKFVPNEKALAILGNEADCGGKKWKNENASFVDGLVDLDAVCDGKDYSVAYLVANVKSPKDVKNCKLLMGSDDYIKVWVNGVQVHVYKEDLRAAHPDDDTVGGINLKKGWNTILIKCVDVYGGWGIYCRITNAKEKAFEVK